MSDSTPAKEERTLVYLDLPRDASRGPQLLADVRRFARRAAVRINMAAEARLPVTARLGTEFNKDDLWLFVGGTKPELDMFFARVEDAEERERRKVEAVEKAKKEARALVQRAKAADYSAAPNPTLAARPKLVATRRS
jgi:hypothetical protein